MRRETKINIFLSISFLFIAIVVFSYLKGSRAKLQKSPEKVQTPLLRTIKALRGDFAAQFRTFGSVKAQHQLVLNSEVSGRVKELHPAFLEGGEIKAGETIITLDQTDLILALKQAEASLELSLAQLQTLQQESANANASLTLQQQTLELSTNELKRQEQMFTQKTISRQSLENAIKSNQSQKLAVLNLENQRSLIPSRIKQMEASIKINRAKLNEAQNRLIRSSVMAPFNGRVVSKNVSVGQYLNVGGRIGELLNLDELEIATPIPSSELHWLNEESSDYDHPVQKPTSIIGKSVKLGFLAPVSKDALGTIKRVSAFLDDGTRSLTAFIQLNSIPLMGESTQKILPGSFCQVRFKGKMMRDVLKVPRSSLKLSKIQVVRDNHLKILPVEIIRDEGEQVYVRAEIAPEEQIVAFYSERNSIDEKVLTRSMESI